MSYVVSTQAVPQETQLFVLFSCLDWSYKAIILPGRAEPLPLHLSEICALRWFFSMWDYAYIFWCLYFYRFTFSTRKHCASYRKKIDVINEATYILYLPFSFGNWVLCHEYYGDLEISIHSSYAT